MEHSRGCPRGCGDEGSRGSTKRGASVLLAGAIALVLLGAVLATASAQQSAAAPLVFDGATVVDVEQGKLVPDQRVIITGNRIQTVGNRQAVPMPQGAQVVEAQGKYLIPGLWDMHVHIQPSISPAQYVEYLIYGVTGFRDAGAMIALDTLLRWRREILAGTRVGPPQQILSGHAFQESADCRRSQNTIDLTICFTDTADARHLVDSFKTAGADMIKPRGVGRAAYFAIAAEARRQGIPFGGHAEKVTAIEASDSGARLIDHMVQLLTPSLLDLCDPRSPSVSVEQCQSVAARLRQNGTWVVPTLATYAFSAAIQQATQEEPDPSDSVGVDRWRARAILTYHAEHELSIDALRAGGWLPGYIARHDGMTGSETFSDTAGALSIVQRVGLPVVAGTDLSPMGPRGLHLELAISVAEGLTPLNALQSATLNPAKVLQATDSLGTVAPGKLADLVLLDRDPLADITNTTTVRAVVANGRYFDRATLDHLMAKAQQP